MANRKRTNPVQFYLDDEEQYILDEKFKISGMNSKSAFLRNGYRLQSWQHLRRTGYPHLSKIRYGGRLGSACPGCGWPAGRISKCPRCGG